MEFDENEQVSINPTDGLSTPSKRQRGTKCQEEPSQCHADGQLHDSNSSQRRINNTLDHDKEHMTDDDSGTDTYAEQMMQIIEENRAWERQRETDLEDWRKSLRIQLGNEQIFFQERDVERLAANEWYNDKIIYAFLVIMKNRIGVDDILILDSAGFLGDGRLVHTSQEFLRKKDLSRVSVILSPFNLNGNHWILLVLYTSLKIFTICDSLVSLEENNNHASWVKYKSLFEVSMNEIVAVQPERLGTFQQWKFGIDSQIPQQLNADDCGVFVCYFSEAILREVLEGNLPSYTNCTCVRECQDCSSVAHLNRTWSSKLSDQNGIDLYRNYVKTTILTHQHQ